MGNSPSQSYPSLDNAEIHRQLAGNYAQQRGEALGNSKKAYSAGRHHEAKSWSEESKRLCALMEKENRIAADLLFQRNNQQKGLGIDTIDLHGLHVKEATDRVIERLELCKKRGQRRLVVVVGRGNHSLNGIAKLKPAMAELIDRLSLRCTAGIPNEGCLLVEFVDAKEKGFFGWLDGGCSIL